MMTQRGRAVPAEDRAALLVPVFSEGVNGECVMAHDVLAPRTTDVAKRLSSATKH